MSNRAGPLPRPSSATGGEPVDAAVARDAAVAGVAGQRRNQPRHRRAEGDGRNCRGCARTTARAARQYPPTAIAPPGPVRLARIVPGRPQAPRPKPRRQSCVQPADRRAQQQRRARRGDQRLAAGDYPQPFGTPVTVHPRSPLRSAFLARRKQQNRKQSMPFRTSTGRVAPKIRDQLRRSALEPDVSASRARSLLPVLGLSRP